VLARLEVATISANNFRFATRTLARSDSQQSGHDDAERVEHLATMGLHGVHYKSSFAFRRKTRQSDQ
jgi:hypothetical protein